jgi:hypothetical protein
LGEVQRLKLFERRFLSEICAVTREEQRGAERRKEKSCITRGFTVMYLLMNIEI